MTVTREAIKFRPKIQVGLIVQHALKRLAWSVAKLIGFIVVLIIGIWLGLGIIMLVCWGLEVNPWVTVPLTIVGFISLEKYVKSK